MPEKNVLLVDDDERIIKILTFLFLSKGYKVSTARNGVGAFEFLETAIPDFIILDLAMPNMDGITFYCKMMENERFADIPVIILSALPSSENLSKINLPDPRYYIHKPFRTAELMAIVSEVSAGKKETSDLEYKVEVSDSDKVTDPLL